MDGSSLLGTAKRGSENCIPRETNVRSPANSPDLLNQWRREAILRVRDDFSEVVKRTVAARVNHLCSNPSCRAPTSGPQEHSSKSLNVGVAAHITAASQGGPRYNPAQTAEERRHPDNAIWLCQNCAKLVDNDESRFTESELRKWKQDAEAEALAKIGKATGSSEEGSRTVVEELIARVHAATCELTQSWLRSRRLAGRPQISLQAVRLERENKDTEQVLGLANIYASLREAHRIVLEAPAGRGKTTTLVQLAELDADKGGLSFLIDLPLWARSKSDILDFIAGRREFLSRGVTAGELAELYRIKRFSFLLNGWNEISENYYEDAVVALKELERSFPEAGIIVATRTHHITPPLPGAYRARLLSLTRTQRNDYLNQSLGTNADALSSMLDNSPVLDALTRTPLILSEVTTIFQLGGAIPATKMGVLGEVMRLLDQSEDHRASLERPPLMGHGSDYLTELAIRMTAQGGNTLAEQDARVVVKSVSLKLRESGQLETPPEPALILNTLCDHHVLERLDYLPVAFRFEHQQFQEFYAAEQLKRLLRKLVENGNQDQHQDFVKSYMNAPAWEEPLRMVAEEIGALSADTHTEDDVVQAGKLLVEMALGVDPIFAGELLRLCGKSVWKWVRTAVAERLRLWYRVADENHQRCALAGMLATSSNEFVDIILPLLTSDDQQVRLSTYRAGTEFHLSSLGQDWRNVVNEWKEEARIELIHELTMHRWRPEIADIFALADPSLKVRVEAIEALSWAGSDSSIARLLEALDDDGFEEAIKKLAVERIPASLRQRALLVYQRLLNKAEDTVQRLRLLIGAAELGDTGILETVKGELAHLQPDRLNDHVSEYIIKPALNIVRKTDPQWASHWVARRIVDSSLRPKGWIELVTCVPDDLKEKLLEGIRTEDPQQVDTMGITLMLPAIGDVALAETIFSRLCAVRRSVSNTVDVQNDSKRATVRKLENLFRALSPSVAVEGLSNCFAREYEITEFATVVEAFSRVDSKYSDLRNQLRDDLRQNLRTYVKNGLKFALSQDDFRGELKAHLATVLARIGEPGDMHDLYELTQAELERVRKGRAALAQGERSELAKGGSISYALWHVRAVATLGPEEAETVLLDALQAPEYELEAASALVRLATTQNVGGLTFGYKEKDYCLVWEARAGRRPAGFDEELSERYSLAIKQRISMLLNERASSVQPSAFDFRLIELANILAALDRRDSAELIFQIVSLPGKFFVNRRVEALENLLFNGINLPTEATLNVLNPIIDQWFNDNLDSSILKRCLCLLPFVDVPSAGIERMGQVISDKDFPRYELPGVLPALGCSRCPEALTLLRSIASTEVKGTERITEEWIKAVAKFGGPDSTRILLSFVEPADEGFILEIAAQSYHGDLLARSIVSIADADPAIKQRILRLCDMQLPPAKRAVLTKVIATLGTGEALLAGLNLIDDSVTSNHTATSSVPYDLWKAMETAFLERRPYGKTGSSYTLVPRSSNAIRTRLFEMSLRDNRRRQSAFSLLGQIEVWRLEYGRPSAEPRHPAIESGEPWPPINHNSYFVQG